MRIDAVVAWIHHTEWVQLLEAVEVAYRQGLPKADLLAGETSVGRVMRLDQAGRQAWHHIRSHRGQGDLAVAVWCAQKEEA